MGFFAQAKERTRRIKRRAMDGRPSNEAIARERRRQKIDEPRETDGNSIREIMNFSKSKEKRFD